MTLSSALLARRSHSPLVRPSVLGSGPAPYYLSGLLALASALSALPTLLWPSLLGGPAVMVGSARGTALVVLVLTLPTLLFAVSATARGSARGLVLWLGAIAHLIYQGVMFCFATPLNSLFLFYVAMLGLALYTGGVLLFRLDVAAFATRLVRAPVGLVAGVLATVAILNAALWLFRVVPSIGAADPTVIVEGTGLTTSPVFVQDLAVWLPLALLAAVLCWRRSAWGLLMAGVVLVLWTLEGVTVATDQLFGYWADSTSDWASPAGALIFVVLTIVTAVPMFLYLAALDRRG